MVKVIPAHIENGQVVADGPLPAKGDVRSVSIVLELAEASQTKPRDSTLPKLLGLLKDVGDPQKEYVDYLEQKYR